MEICTLPNQSCPSPSTYIRIPNKLKKSWYQIVFLVDVWTLKSYAPHPQQAAYEFSIQKIPLLSLQALKELREGYGRVNLYLFTSVSIG